MSAQAPSRDHSAEWEEVAIKFTGTYWFVLLYGKGRKRNLAAINRHIYGEWEMFEHGAITEIDTIWNSLKDANAPAVAEPAPEITFEEADDFLAEAEIVPAEPPIDPYATLPNYGRF